ncbi:thaicobrin-like [Rhea pennata]|uniref:thaicobrin-like n=1 Tax=Rhea pennata TaxID=8795 RepID=UPI002E26CB31
MQAPELAIEEGEAQANEVEERSEKVDVTLDPDTANPFLVLAADRRGVRRGDAWALLPDSLERFTTEPCVLGCPGFTGGQHHWKVAVADGGDWWATGVAGGSIQRKSILQLSPEEEIWAVGQWFGQYYAFTHPDWTSLHLRQPPRTIQVSLDCAGGQVSFTDAEDGGLIFTFSLHPYPSKTLHPWFYVGSNSQLALCP